MRNTLFAVVVCFVTAGCSALIKSNTGDNGAAGKKHDGRYEYLLAEALRAKYLGNINDAADIFARCIELDNSRSVPWFELAQIFSSKGEGAKALRHASVAARLEPENYWYQLACGSLFVQYQQKDSAIYYFNRAAVADKSSVEAIEILAGLYAEKGEMKRADSLYRKIETSHVLSPELSLFMIDNLIKREEYEEAAARGRDLVKRNPGDSRYEAALADAYYEQGLIEKSDSIYSRIIEKGAEDIEGQFLYLKLLFNRKDYAGLTLFLENIFKSDHVSREAKVSIAGTLAQDTLFILSNSEKFANSMVILEGAYPQDEEVLSIKPLIYETVGNYDEAIRAYESGIETLKPAFYLKERLLFLYNQQKEYQKLFLLGASYSRENNRSLSGKIYYAVGAMELGEYTISEAELDKAMILAGNVDELKVQVLALQSDLQYRRKEFNQVYELLDRALEIAPDDLTLLNNYAYFLAEGEGDLKKALYMIKEVMKTEGDNSTFIDTHAWILYKMGKIKKAHKEMMRIFVRGEEEDADLLEHMGYIKRAMGNCNEALLFWQKAIDQNSANKQLLEEEIAKCKREGY